jgi:hypothetical protein
MVRACISAAILAGLPIAAQTQPAPVHIQNGFLTGNSFRQLSPLAKRSYIMGIVDGLLIAPLVEAPKSKVRWLERCVVNMTDDHVAAIVDKHLAEQPQRWHDPMHVLAYSAFREACR